MLRKIYIQFKLSKLYLPTS